MTWFGLLLGSQRRTSDRRAVHRAVRDEAAAALATGLSCLVAPEHMAAEPYTMLRSWPLLAALRAELAPFAAMGSVIAGLTSLEQVTGDIETVAAIGSGPVGVALAAGYRPEDFAAAGRDFLARYRLRAQLRRALVSRVAPGRLWSAAATATAAHRAGADGAVWYAAPTTDPVTAAELGRAAGTAGVLRCDVLVSDDAAAEHRWGRYVAPKYGAYRDWGFTDSAAQVITGPPPAVAARLNAIVARLAPTGIVLRLCWPDMDATTALQHVDVFGTEVLPELTDVTAATSPLSTGRRS